MRQLTKFAAKRVVSSKLPAKSDVRSVRDSLQVFCYIVWNFEEMHSMQAYLYHWVGGFLQKTLKMRLYAQVYYASVPVPQVEGSCKIHWWRDEWYLLLFAAVSCWCRQMEPVLWSFGGQHCKGSSRGSKILTFNFQEAIALESAAKPTSGPGIPISPLIFFQKSLGKK